ncbi:MAG: TetR/AcrR family transcriptional regulator [Nevskiales bacterium]
MPKGRRHHARPRKPGNKASHSGRERLLRAGLSLFAERGYDGTSVRALATEAGVSFGLIRKYFGSKDGLRDAVEEFVLDELEKFYKDSYQGVYRSAAAQAERAVQFIEHDRDVLRYLRFAFINPQKSTQQLFNRYFAVFQKKVGALAEQGQLGAGADLRWAPFILMFLQLGPLIVEPFARRVLGQSIYAPEILGDRQRAYMTMLSQPFLTESV